MRRPTCARRGGRRSFGVQGRVCAVRCIAVALCDVALLCLVGLCVRGAFASRAGGSQSVQIEEDSRGCAGAWTAAAFEKVPGPRHRVPSVRRSDMQGKGGCSAPMVWPLRTAGGREAARVLVPARIPRPDWKPGHRGIDVLVGAGGFVVAPDTAVVRFAGSVGGKDVVSLTVGTSGSPSDRHRGTLVVSFEPAKTDLAVGDRVPRGARVASLEGASGHCAPGVAHVGVRRSGMYVDPAVALRPSRIVLKPPDGRPPLSVRRGSGAGPGTVGFGAWRAGCHSPASAAVT